MKRCQNEVFTSERDIDRFFEQAPILEIGYTQALWTLLSLLEDHYFSIMVINPLKESELKANIDETINMMAHPIRVCHKLKTQKKTLNHAYIEHHYQMASDWFDLSKNYRYFCSIFPLFHQKQIGLEIEDKLIKVINYTSKDIAYEFYNRLGEYRTSNLHVYTNQSEIMSLVHSRLKIKDSSFSLSFSSDFIEKLVSHLKPFQASRCSLPRDWEFYSFSIEEYFQVFEVIYAMVYGWFIARILASPEIKGMCFESALWCPEKKDLIHIVQGYTKFDIEKVKMIFKYLTLGENGIRNPDIAIQPIIDLRNGHYALSSIVFLNVYWERNLCVLMNQINEEKQIYSKLMNEKESILRQEIIDELKCFDFRFESGQVNGTDVDLAIIDDQNKKCLIIELKWMIEPAEIREVTQRSEEIAKGIDQIKKINRLFSNQDQHLIESVLEVEADYELLGVVGSVNFVGNPRVQDVEVPVVKCWHIVERLKDVKNLSTVMSWLAKRGYLPVLNKDFEVISFPIQVGEWKSEWYGTKPLE